jgi:hypothetical protein
MPTKRPLPIFSPKQIRVVPRSFAWIDTRLRSSQILQCMNAEEIGLYFFLALAADKHGLSCWRLDRVEREIPCFDVLTLRKARDGLIRQKLLAYQSWFAGAVDGSYQLLAIPAVEPPVRSAPGPMAIGNILSGSNAL